MKSMMTEQEAASLIRSGKRMLISGDEGLLARLPHGDWVGGTIPYFMTEEGGMCTHEKVQASVLPDFVTAADVKLYTAEELAGLPSHYPSNGFSYIVVPAFTAAHQVFAKDSSTWPGVFNRPLVGWVAGINLKDLGKAKPKVVNGKTGQVSDSHAVAMQVQLPESKFANTNIVNLFQQGSGDTITFPSTGFEVTDCFVNGKKECFAEYIQNKEINTQQPLVADYHGAMVNVSFQCVDLKSKKVALYAPVFPGLDYKIADPVTNYEAEFQRQFAQHNVNPFFTCNCILNYLYAKLEGKNTGKAIGPMTFGEIAYVLLNQTLVYVSLEDM